MAEKFKTLALAMESACSPVQGLVAFISFVVATATAQKYLLVESSNYCNDLYRMWYKDMGSNRPMEDEFGCPQYPGPTVRVVEHTYADSWDDLDWKKTCYYVQDGTSGWLSPEGEFWGCKYGGHSNLARRVLKKDYAEIEQQGWIHVDEDGAKDKYSWRKAGKKDPTPEQAKWLVDNGHDLDPYGRRAQKKAEEISLGLNGEYTIDVAADKAAYERMMARAKKVAR